MRKSKFFLKNMERDLTISEVINNSLQKINKMHCQTRDEDILKIELLLMKVLNCRREFLYTRLEQKIPPGKLYRFNKLLHSLYSGKPIQYIVGETEFYGLKFSIKPPVFIPQPLTEFIVDEAIKIVKLSNHKRVRRILDIGTGCGNIAISILKNTGNTLCYAIERSPEAIKLAIKNAKFHKVSSRLKIIQADFFELQNFKPKILSQTKFDVIVSNPPYISKASYQNVSPEIRKYVDKKALISNDNGLEFIKNIILVSEEILNKNGYTILEIGLGQKEKLKKFLSQLIQVDKFNFIEEAENGRVVVIKYK